MFSHSQYVQTHSLFCEHTHGKVFSHAVCVHSHSPCSSRKCNGPDGLDSFCITLNGLLLKNLVTTSSITFNVFLVLQLFSTGKQLLLSKELRTVKIISILRSGCITLIVLMAVTAQRIFKRVDH